MRAVEMPLSIFHSLSKVAAIFPARSKQLQLDIERNTSLFPVIAKRLSRGGRRVIPGLASIKRCQTYLVRELLLYSPYIGDSPSTNCMPKSRMPVRFYPCIHHVFHCVSQQRMPVAVAEGNRKIDIVLVQFFVERYNQVQVLLVDRAGTSEQCIVVLTSLSRSCGTLRSRVTLSRNGMTSCMLSSRPNDTTISAS